MGSPGGPGCSGYSLHAAGSLMRSAFLSCPTYGASDTLAGFDLKTLMSYLPDFKVSDLFANVPALATATAIAAAWSPIVGSTPSVVNRGNYYEVVFAPDQEDRAVEWILTQLNREPGPVRIEAGGMAVKVITRKYWPYFAGAALLGAVVGYTLHGRGR